MSSRAISASPIATSPDSAIPRIERSAGSAFGHTFQMVWNGLETGADHFFRSAAAIKDDLSSVTLILRGVGNTLTNIKNSQGVQRFGGKLTIRFSDAITFIDGIQILSDVHYFWNGEYKKKQHKPLCIAGHVAFAAGDLATCGLWLDSMGFKLSKAAESIGKIRVFNAQPFKFLPKIPMGTVVSGAFFGGFALLAGDAVYRIVDPQLARQSYAAEKRIKAVLDLAYYVTAAAGIVFGWAGVTALPVIIGLGLVSAGFGIAGFVYSLYQGKKLDPEEDVYR